MSTVMKWGRFKSPFQRVCHIVDEFPSIALAARVVFSGRFLAVDGHDFPTGGRQTGKGLRGYDAKLAVRHHASGLHRAARGQRDGRLVNRGIGRRFGSIHGVNHFTSAGVGDGHQIVGVAIRNDWEPGRKWIA